MFYFLRKVDFSFINLLLTFLIGLLVLAIAVWAISEMPLLIIGTGIILTILILSKGAK